MLKNQFFYESSNICEFDISPVDEIANGIVQIIYNYGHQNKIFHMMNPQKFTIQTLADKFNNLGYGIKIIKDKDFYKKIIKMNLNDNSLVINDYNLYTNISYLNIKTKNKITQKYLENVGIRYKKIDERYLTKVIEYCKNIKFI